jgi:hypothetical protein
MQAEGPAVKASRESRWTGIMAMVLGVLTPVIGYGVTQNSFVYPPGDPRGEPWYDTLVIASAVVVGALVFVVGLVLLWRSRTAGRK